MSIQKAIEKAVEGGYEDGVYAIKLVKEYQEENKPELAFLHEKGVTLQPLFWQSLGKALGWNRIEDMMEGTIEACRQRGISRSNYIHDWLYHWHSFISHLADGKSPDEFFANLLSS